MRRDGGGGGGGGETSWLIPTLVHPHKLAKIAVVTIQTHTHFEAVMSVWNASNGIAWHITHTPCGALSNKYKFRQHDLPG